MNIREQLENEIESHAKINSPALMQRFVLRNGAAYNAMPYKGPRGIPRACFQNAEAFCRHKPQLDYVEGYAWRTDLPILIHHAWCVDTDNNVIDTTWDNPETAEYFGVKFSRKILEQEMRKHKSASVLDTRRGVNTDLFFSLDSSLEIFFAEFRENAKTKLAL